MAEGDEIAVETKKSKRWLWIVIGVVVVGGVGAFFLVDYFRPPKAVAAEGGAAGSGSSEQEAVGVASRVKSTMNLDAFLVNLADEENARFVKATFRLGLDQAGLGERLAGDTVVVSAARDKIISILTTKTSEQLLSVEGKEKLRAEIRDLLNPLLPSGRIVEVYIMDFVVQL